MRKTLYVGFAALSTLTTVRADEVRPLDLPFVAVRERIAVTATRYPRAQKDVASGGRNIDSYSETARAIRVGLRPTF